ncbi:MAG: hypothetical protein ACYTKD_30275 [Planctomycetota bacterium]|jgi:hypothetical protein
MPFIAYKTQTIEVFYVQTRRIACEMCREPYVYLHWGTFSEQTTGLPLISSDQGMSKALAKSVEGRLSRMAGRKRVGIAKCAHCGRPQSWMLGRTYAANLIGWSLGLGAVGFVVGLMVSLNTLTAHGSAWVLGMSLVGLLLGGTIGFLRARAKLGAAGERDPRSMTDEEFRVLLRECSGMDADHPLYWYRRILKKRTGAKAMPVSLGFVDEAGEFELPEGFVVD